MAKELAGSGSFGCKDLENMNILKKSMMQSNKINVRLVMRYLR